MKASLIATALVSAIAGALFAAAAKPTTYVDTGYGFSLDVPEFPRLTKGKSAVVFTALAPPKKGFASNVNVIVEEIKTTREDFKAQTRKQFADRGWRIIEEKDLDVSGYDGYLVEYDGLSQGRSLRWLALAVITPDRVLLTTYTAPAAEFPRLEKAFQASLKSFKVTK